MHSLAESLFMFTFFISTSFINFSYLAFRSQSNERQFLKDFISGAPGSSGARLAAWLQPEPRLDPNKYEKKSHYAN